MSLFFTKMHGAGNDFVVINNMNQALELTQAKVAKLADRHFGVGADQVLIVEPASSPENDFKYRIFNADGQEVQQCGNGARCFALYVYKKGLTNKKKIKVETRAGVIEPELVDGNLVKVNMGPVVFEPSLIPFVVEGLNSRQVGGLKQYQLPVETSVQQQGLWVTVASMGNPHVVIVCDKPVDDGEVERLGQLLESHPRFPERVNVGFMHVIDRSRVSLRVFERGVGETLACGTGACAAACVGMNLGLLGEKVDVVKRGGTLSIEWAGEIGDNVMMTGPAQFVFEGEFAQ